MSVTVVVTGEHFPAKCKQTDQWGTPPSCTQQPDGTWQVSYPEPSDGSVAFAAFFVLALLVGIGITIWKVTTAQRMARDSGMDPGDATAMTLLTDDGLEATYLASNLRNPQTSQPTTPTRSSEERLRELESLRSQGLVTEEEYAARRRAVLDSL